MGEGREGRARDFMKGLVNTRVELEGLNVSGASVLDRGVCAKVIPMPSMQTKMMLRYEKVKCRRIGERRREGGAKKEREMGGGRQPRRLCETGSEEAEGCIGGKGDKLKRLHTNS